ncbi:MAG: acyl carrier protein [Rickettsiales bacterium]|jgi:acyl carrier protein|nr:acyl carrier protein [Rickettsiales bacterium]
MNQTNKNFSSLDLIQNLMRKTLNEFGYSESDIKINSTFQDNGIDSLDIIGFIQNMENELGTKLNRKINLMDNDSEFITNNIVISKFAEIIDRHINADLYNIVIESPKDYRKIQINPIAVISRMAEKETKR